MAIGYDTNVVTGEVESIINKLIKNTRDQMYIIEDLVIMLPDFSDEEIVYFISSWDHSQVRSMLAGILFFIKDLNAEDNNSDE